jgi:hypothetical protein
MVSAARAASSSWWILTRLKSWPSLGSSTARIPGSSARPGALRTSEPVADRSSDPFVVGQREVGTDGSCALDEERQSVVRGQGRDCVLPLPADPERFPARDDHRDAASAGEQVGDGGRGREYLLEVVEDEEDGAVLERLDDGPRQRLADDFRDPELVRDRVHDEVRIADRRQRNEVDTVRVGARELGCGLECEPRLASAAGPRQRDQTRLLRREHGRQLRDLGAPADER